MPQNYSDKLKDHYHRPRNVGKLEYATHFAEALNPLCGDETKVYLQVKNEIIKTIKHETRGCMIAVASASVVSEYLINKKLSAIKKLDLSAIEQLLDVKVSPARASCATLALEALKKSLFS